MCPQCHALERHRLQKLVLDRLRLEYDFSRLSCLHVAPEACLSGLLRDWFRDYVTADITPDKKTDICADLCDLPIPNGSYDVVFASHVLEHIRDDKRALAETARVLKPGGFCLLPVPVVAPVTVEYAIANATESGHVRAPGLDYFAQYDRFFRSVVIFQSRDFPAKYQTYLYEDRARPAARFPTQRPPMRGRRHPDYVPVCYAGGERGLA
jgi:SAM-dependent methyltransferase